MIVINLTINITGAPGNWRIDDVVDLNSAIVDAIKPRPRPGLQHQASCPICKDWTQFYSSPAKARQGLAGHQSWCGYEARKRRERDAKRSQQVEG